ncbi:hypothetical protein RINTHM_12180 [Richelia intracellularis HM01]|nr:hypothetical protein RINTHM_12180 [Richelia intracellularis HM01]
MSPNPTVVILSSFIIAAILGAVFLLLQFTDKGLSFSNTHKYLGVG